VVVPRHTRRLAGFDDAVLSLYAKGLTTGDIVNHLADIYGSEVSRDLVSRVTDAVVEQKQQWQSQPPALRVPQRRGRGRVDVVCCGRAA
jgi:transposase-like protein